MIKQLLDNLTDEFWDNRGPTRPIDGWPNKYCTFFYSDCGKISMVGKKPSKSKLRKEIWNRLKDRGWGYLTSMKVQRTCLQGELSRPFQGIAHKFDTNEIWYLLDEYK